MDLNKFIKATLISGYLSKWSEYSLSLRETLTEETIAEGGPF